MKILLVEDNEFVRTLILEQLRPEGYEVTATSNADDALQAIEDGNFSLLITDIVLPRTDGGKLMKRVRQLKPEMPILAITGGMENAVEDYANYADMFADKTLIKPISKDELLRAVKALVKTWPARRP